MVISANWMTLGFANAKRNVQAPARDPLENSAPAARNFAEPFSCEAPSGSPGFGGGAVAATGRNYRAVAWPPHLALQPALAWSHSAFLGRLRPRIHLWFPPSHPADPSLT